MFKDKFIISYNISAKIGTKKCESREKPYLSNLNFGKYEQALQLLEDDSLENMKLLNN